MLAALEPEQEKVALELAGDVAVLGADEMQHLDDRAVRRHRAAGCERDQSTVAASTNPSTPMPTAIAARVIARMRSTQPR